MGGLNIAYEVQEQRPLWKVLATAVALTISIALLFLIALTASALAAWWFPALGLRWVQWPVIAVLLVVAFALFYRFGPNLYDRQWQWSTPGAAAGLILWLTAAGLMRFYTAHFHHSYGLIYKQLNGAVALLLWFYFTSAAVLIGGEMNSEIEKAARKRDGSSGNHSREGS